MNLPHKTSTTTILIWIIIALFVGFIIGRYVESKAQKDYYNHNVGHSIA